MQSRETPIRVYRYRDATTGRRRIVVFFVIWLTLAAAFALGDPRSQLLLALSPVWFLLLAFALYFDRVLRESVALFPDRLVWTDLWSRRHTLALDQIRDIEEDRTLLPGLQTQYVVRGDQTRIRFFSTIEGSEDLVYQARRAWRGLPPVAELPVVEGPWPGRTEYRYRTGSETIRIEGMDLVWRRGSRERLRVPYGGLRGLTFDSSDESQIAVAETDAGPLRFTDDLEGYDDLVRTIRLVTARRYAAVEAVDCGRPFYDEGLG